MNDWYLVSKQQVIQYGGAGLLNYYNGSLLNALKSIYPSQDWNRYRFSMPHHITSGKSSFSKIQYLFNNMANNKDTFL